eukprot:CFRG5089T1
MGVNMTSYTTQSIVPTYFSTFTGHASPTFVLVGTLLGLLLVMFIRNVILLHISGRSLKDITSPKGALPVFGHALALLTNTPWDKMKEWALSNKNDLVRLQIMLSWGVVVSTPAHCNHVLNKKCSNYVKDVEMSYRPFIDILGKGIITSDGPYWKKQRTLLSHAFRVSILEDTMTVAKGAVDRMSVKLEKIRGTGVPIEIGEEFRLLTLEVIGELVLSLPAEESNIVFPDLYLPIVTEANKRIWDPVRKFLPTPTQFHYRKTVKGLNDYMCQLIRKRWAERASNVSVNSVKKVPDILDQTLQTIDPASFDEATVLQLRDEFKSFILAGHETSASMLTWCLYECTQNPDVLQKLIAESKSVFGPGRLDNGDIFGDVPLPSRDELSNLNYTVNSLKETLRKYTPVPIVSRVAKETDVIDGHTIPAGTKIFVNIKGIHDDPSLWEHPDEFKPERFDMKFDPYSYLPFINGPRNCLGQHLALLEARIVLSLLLQRFKFTPVDEKCGILHPFIVPVIPKSGMNVYVD